VLLLIGFHTIPSAGWQAGATNLEEVVCKQQAPAQAHGHMLDVRGGSLLFTTIGYYIEQHSTPTGTH
jgi:hypothetical protein